MLSFRFGGQPRRKGFWPWPSCRGPEPDDSGRSTLLPQHKRSLPLTQELDVDLGQKLGVEQGAVLHPLRVVDAITLAKGIKGIGASWMLAPRQRQGIDDALHWDRWTPGAIKLHVDERHVEAGIMNDQRSIPDEGQKFVDDC